MQPVELRAGGAADLAQLCVLATHVFVHTYCAGGLRPDQAREALSAYSLAEFERRLAAGHRFTLACRGEHLLGFADTILSASAPLPELSGSLELARLYVSPGAHGQGLGRALLHDAERLAAQRRCHGLWLTAWVDNAKALAFYRVAGYADVGRTDHLFEGRAYENRVLFKKVTPG